MNKPSTDWLHALPIPAILADRHGFIEDVNEAFLSMPRLHAETASARRWRRAPLSALDPSEPRWRFREGSETESWRWERADANGRLHCLDVTIRSRSSDRARNAGFLVLLRDATTSALQDRRETALSRLRSQIRHMRDESDLEPILFRVREVLQELGIPFYQCAVNLVDDSTSPPTIRCHSMKADGWRWDESIVVGEGAETVASFWKLRGLHYRPNLSGKFARDDAKTPLRSIVDAAFSHGTLAVNSPQRDAFTEDDLISLRQIAEVLSDGFLRWDGIRELRRQNEALRQEERLWQIAMDTMPYHIYVKDRQSRFLRANAKITEVIGAEHPSDLIGKTDFDFYAESLAQGYFRDEQRLMELDEPIHRIRRDDERDQWWSIIKIPLKADDGTVVGLVGIGQNITHQKRAEAELQSLNALLRRRTEALERSNEDLKHFASAASHDLQEPLRKIRNFAEMLRERAGNALDDASHLYLDRIENAARRMSDLVRDLLELSLIDRRPETLSEVDLTRVAREAADDLGTANGPDDADVRIDPLFIVQAEASQMRQLFQNLLSNALKFRRPGIPPRIRVFGRLMESETEPRCEIVVEDNGIGIPSERRQQVFQPFLRLHGRASYEGSGVGLAICRKVVQRHRGTIRIEDAPNGGTRMIVQLPMRQPPRLETS